MNSASHKEDVPRVISVIAETLSRKNFCDIRHNDNRRARIPFHGRAGLTAVNVLAAFLTALPHISHMAEYPSE